MSRKKKAQTEKQKNADDLRRRQHKLNTIKSGFETGAIKNFEQIFAIMAESRLAKELHMGFTTFRNKVNAPGDFTLREIELFAELIGLELPILLPFFVALHSKAKKHTV